jgi:hypothetical protein
MIVLKAATESLQLATSTTAAVDVSVSFADITTTTFTPSSTETKINTVATTTILAAPAVSTQRQIKLISISNIDASLSTTITITKLIVATTYSLNTVVTLLIGETLQYMDGVGWTYYSSSGIVKASATASGTNGLIQFNSFGQLGSAAGFSFNSSNQILGITSASSTINLGMTPAGTNPTPVTGVLNIFGRTVANRGLVAAQDQYGSVTSYQPILARNKVGYWNPQGNSISVPGFFGLPALTSQGAATIRTVATTSLATRMRRIGYPSIATAGTFAGARLATAMFSSGSGSNDGSGFTLVERWVESDPAVVSGRRAFHGMTASTGSFGNAEVTTLTNQVGVCQLSTDASQWYWIGSGLLAQSATAVGTAIGAPAGNSTTAWELAIYAPNSVANTFYLQLTNITTGVVATNTFTGAATVIPQSSTLLSWLGWATNNATALAVGIDLCSLYIETDN